MRNSDKLLRLARRKAYQEVSWFREIGLKEPDAKVFANSFYAPLSREIHNALADLFNMRWPDAELERKPPIAADFYVSASEEKDLLPSRGN